MINIIFLAHIKAPRSLFIIAFFLDISLIGGMRFFYRFFRRFSKNKFKILKNKKNALIIGGGDTGELLVKEIKLHPELRLNLVGILDDDNTIFGRKIHGIRVLGNINNFNEVVSEKKVDEIIITNSDNKIINDIYQKLSNTNCKVRILPAITKIIDGSFVVNKIRDIKIEDLLGRETVKLNNYKIMNFLSEKIVIVTGGGGSIGSELCRQIAKFKPKELIIIDNYENNAYAIENELSYKHKKLKLKVKIANIRERHRLELIFKEIQPNVVFHAAAHKHVPLMEANPTEAISNNIFGTLNVAECADKFKVEKFVLISTDKAVNPTNIMGATKRVAEMIIQGINKNSNSDFVAVRFGNVLGSNGSVIPLFKKQIKKGGPVTVTHPEINRFFMTIPEASQLVLQAGSMAKGGEIFVLDMGQPVRIYDLAKNLIKLSGYEPEVDIDIKFTGLRPGEKLYEELMLEEEGMKKTESDKIHVAKPLVFSYKKLKKDIEFLKDLIFTNPEHSVKYMKQLVPTYKIDNKNKDLKINNVSNFGKSIELKK
jgi:FlaA1/EpsC-like NDP-sugar epimerase